jgi:hypothetical protein
MLRFQQSRPARACPGYPRLGGARTRRRGWPDKPDHDEHRVRRPQWVLQASRRMTQRMDSRPIGGVASGFEFTSIHLGEVPQTRSGLNAFCREISAFCRCITHSCRTVFIFRAEPDTLTAGVALGQAPVTDMLRKRFPVGSPASVLEEELKHEGCWGSIHLDRIGGTERRFSRYVQYRRRVGLITPEVTTIAWEVDDDGRLTDVRGSKYFDIPVP